MAQHFSMDVTLVLHAQSLAEAQTILDEMLDNLSGSHSALAGIVSEDVELQPDYDCPTCKRKTADK